MINSAIKQANARNFAEATAKEKLVVEGDLISKAEVLHVIDERIEQIKRDADAINRSYSHLSFAEGVHDGYCRLKCDIRVLPCAEQTQMVDKSNFSMEQYKADLETAHECGKSHWIPVTERLPEVGHRVIFSMNNDEIYIGALHTSDNGLKITLEPTGISYWYSFENVIAWMPLPKPYKEGETE